MTRFVSMETRDIRFPTSVGLHGSDAMNPAPDYSAAYVVITTDAGDGHLLVDETTQLDRFRDQLRWNDLYYLLARAL